MSQTYRPYKHTHFTPSRPSTQLNVYCCTSRKHTHRDTCIHTFIHQLGCRPTHSHSHPLAAVFPLSELAWYSSGADVMRSDSYCGLFGLDVIHLTHCWSNLQQQTINSKQIVPSELKGALSVLISLIYPFVIRVWKDSSRLAGAW